MKVCNVHEQESKALTISISNQCRVSKSYCNGKSEDHQYPVYFWDVDLPIYVFRGVDNFHSWKATKGMALFNN